jgi:hypothetical protein
VALATPNRQFADPFCFLLLVINIFLSDFDFNFFFKKIINGPYASATWEFDGHNMGD